MKRKLPPFATVCLLLAAIAVAGSTYWHLTRGNVSWHVRQVLPGAVVYGAPEISDERYRFAHVVRLFVHSYFPLDERVGFNVTDSAEPLDLQELLTRMPHGRIWTIRIKRCRITRLCPAEEPGFPRFITFIDCDFSALPPEQRALLQLPDPSEPGYFMIGKLSGL